MGIAMKLFTHLLNSVYRRRGRDVPGELVSSIAADALAPCVAKSSAVMVLTM